MGAPKPIRGDRTHPDAARLPVGLQPRGQVHRVPPDVVVGALAPGDARRYQHSDSAMGHLMDQQYALGIRSVNYGAEIDVADIRRVMPEAEIHGHLPPFLLRNGTPQEIEQRIVDDFEKGGDHGKMIVTTAGSLAGGTGVGRMRWFMKVVQDRCRYQ